MQRDTEAMHAAAEAHRLHIKSKCKPSPGRLKTGPRVRKIRPSANNSRFGKMLMLGISRIVSGNATDGPQAQRRKTTRSQQQMGDRNGYKKTRSTF
jgi:hypothetical protein